MRLCAYKYPSSSVHAMKYDHSHMLMSLLNCYAYFFNNSLRFVIRIYLLLNPFAIALQ